MFVSTWSDEQRLLAVTDLEGRIVESSGYFALPVYLEKGYRWSEENTGNTALGLAMRTGTLSYLRFEKHTDFRLKDHYTIASPIYKEDNTRVVYLLMAGKIDAEFDLALAVFKFVMRQLEQRISELLLNLELCDAIADALLAVNENENLIYANDTALQLLGVEAKNKDDILSAAIPMSYFLQNKMQVIPDLRLKQQMIRKEITLKTKGGTKVYQGECTVLPQHDYAGVQRGALIILARVKESTSQKNQTQSFFARYTMLDIVYLSRAMAETIKMAELAAMGPLPVLIQGESGTGKELFAHAIHDASRYRQGPFVVVDCSTIPRELVESELFGYAEGAFTGAVRGGKVGKFQLAQDGTIFLDEIGEMPLEIQAKLLRVLQNRQITKVGSSMPIEVNIRVIAATNKDLFQEVQENHFREDLFYRLNVMDLTIPPLRNRVEDIPLLAEYFVEKYQGLFYKQDIEIHPETVKLLLQYEWPGNVRELENVIARAVNLCSNQIILPANLPPRINHRTDEPVAQPQSYQSIDEIEKGNIVKALKVHSGNKSEVAKGLRISRSTLYKKMKEYGIEE